MPGKFTHACFLVFAFLAMLPLTAAGSDLRFTAPCVGENLSNDPLRRDRGMALALLLWAALCPPAVLPPPPSVAAAVAAGLPATGPLPSSKGPRPAACCRSGGTRFVSPY